MTQYALGIDYGTNSCRSLLIDLADGREVGSTVFPYPSGELGVLLDPRDPHVARQNPQDYLDGLVAVTRGALEQARAAVPGFDPAQVVGIGLDTTGSTPIPVDLPRPRTAAALAHDEDAMHVRAHVIEMLTSSSRPAARRSSSDIRATVDAAPQTAAGWAAASGDARHQEG